MWVWYMCLRCISTCMCRGTPCACTWMTAKVIGCPALSPSAFVPWGRLSLWTLSWAGSQQVQYTFCICVTYYWGCLQAGTATPSSHPLVQQVLGEPLPLPPPVLFSLKKKYLYVSEPHMEQLMSGRHSMNPGATVHSSGQLLIWCLRGVCPPYSDL